MGQQKTIIAFFIILVFIFVILGVSYYKVYYPKQIPEREEVEVIDTVPDKEVSVKKQIPKIPSQEEDIIPNTEPIIEEWMDEALFEEEVDGNKNEEIEITPISEKYLGHVHISYAKSIFSKLNTNEQIPSNNSRITQEEKEVLRIDQIKAGIDFRNVPSASLFKGMLYYSGENGRLESFIYIDPDGKMHEYLVSYDPKGDYVNSLEIGVVNPGNDEKKYAIVANNKLSVFELQSTKEIGAKKEEKVTEYFINPQMQFNKGKTYTKLK